MLKTIDRYVLKEFLKILLLAMATLITFYETVVFMDYLGHFQKHGASTGMVARYMMFKVPMAVFHVTPICVLMASLLTAVSLSRNGELVAMKAAGMSMLRIFMPVLAAAAVISLFNFLDSEHLFYLAAKETNRIYHEEIRKEPRKSLFSKNRFWYKAKDGSIWNVGHIDAKQKILRDVSIYRFDAESGKIRTRSSSPEAYLAGNRWIFRSFVERTFFERGRFTEKRWGEKSFSLNYVDSKDFDKVQLNAEEMNRSQLAEYIDDIREKGYDTTTYLIEKYAKVGFPLITLVMPLIAIPMGVRSSRRGGAMIGVAVAIVIGGLFWFTFSMGQAFGRAGLLPPLISVFAPHFLFASGGLFMLISNRQ